MSIRRVGWMTAMVVAALLCTSCGQVYRPVVIPTTTTLPNPANFHAVFAINSNGSYSPGSPANFSFDVGSAMQIDVAGDAVIAATGGTGSTVGHIGVNPTHAMIVPNNGRVFVATAGSVEPNGADVVTAFTPEFASSVSGFTGVTTFTLPNVVGAGRPSTINAISESGSVVTVILNAPLNNVQIGNSIVVSGVGAAGYDGTFSISSVNGTTIQYADSVMGLAPSSGGTVAVSPGFCSYFPDFVAAAQSATVYVANYGVDSDPNCDLSSTDSIAVLSSAQNAITNIVSLPAGSHPVALAQAQSPNGNKLYVANQGNNTVGSFNTVDFTQNTVQGFNGTTPVWLVARADGQKLYVLTQGDGQLFTIDTADDTVTSHLSVGAGANFIAYDSHLQRLYVTNPANSTLFVFSATGGAGDTPSLLKSINLAPSAVSGNYPSCANPCPVSVAALPDGTRAYVASYQLVSCTDPAFSASCQVFPQVTVIDALSNTVKTTVFPLPQAQGSAAPPSVAEASNCIPSVPYTPLGVTLAGTSTPGFSTRFRLPTTAAADSTRVYVGVCDAGSVAVINTTTSTIAVGGNQPDTLVTNLVAPFSAGSPQGGSSEPPPQNPILLLTGQ
jgi:DNA-binding beta-propeller fold protein YncE